MSVFYDALDLAIYNRLNGDSTLTAIVGTRIFNTWESAVEDGAQPSVLYRRDSGHARRDAFGARVTLFAFYIDVFVEVHPGGSAGASDYDGLAIGRSITARVQGDWPTTPTTYGLDRYAIGSLGSTGYFADSIGMNADWEENHDEGMYRWTAPMQLFVSKSGA